MKKWIPRANVGGKPKIFGSLRKRGITRMHIKTYHFLIISVPHPIRPFILLLGDRNSSKRTPEDQRKKLNIVLGPNCLTGIPKRLVLQMLVMMLMENDDDNDGHHDDDDDDNDDDDDDDDIDDSGR